MEENDKNIDDIKLQLNSSDPSEIYEGLDSALDILRSDQDGNEDLTKDVIELLISIAQNKPQLNEEIKQRFRVLSSEGSEAAAEALQRLAEPPADDPTQLMGRAERAYYREDYEQAISLFEQVLQIEPENQWAKEQLEKAKLADLTRSQIILDRPAEVIPEKARSLYRRGRSLIGAGAVLEAESLIQSAIENAQDAGIHYTEAQLTLDGLQDLIAAAELQKQGDEALALGEWYEAINIYSQVLRLDPENSTIQRLKRSIENLLQIKTILEILQIQPAIAIIKGYAEQIISLPKMLQESLQISSLVPLAKQVIIGVKQLQDDFEPLIDDIQNNNPELASSLSVLFSQHASDIDNLKVWQTLTQAERLYFGEYYDEAIPIYKEVIEIDPSNQRALIQLDKAKYNAFIKANSIAKQDLRDVPESANMIYKRARSYIAAGDSLSAKLALTESIAEAERFNFEYQEAYDTLNGLQNSIAAAEYKQAGIDALKECKWVEAIKQFEYSIALTPEENEEQKTLKHAIEELLWAQNIIDKLHPDFTDLKANLEKLNALQIKILPPLMSIKNFRNCSAKVEKKIGSKLVQLNKELVAMASKSWSSRKNYSSAVDLYNLYQQTYNYLQFALLCSGLNQNWLNTKNKIERCLPYLATASQASETYRDSKSRENLTFDLVKSWLKCAPNDEILQDISEILKTEEEARKILFSPEPANWSKALELYYSTYQKIDDPGIKIRIYLLEQLIEAKEFLEAQDEKDIETNINEAKLIRHCLDESDKIDDFNRTPLFREVYRANEKSWAEILSNVENQAFAYLNSGETQKALSLCEMINGIDKIEPLLESNISDIKKNIQNVIQARAIITDLQLNDQFKLNPLRREYFSKRRQIAKLLTQAGSTNLSLRETTIFSQAQSDFDELPDLFNKKLVRYSQIGFFAVFVLGLIILAATYIFIPGGTNPNEAYDTSQMPNYHIAYHTPKFVAVGQSDKIDFGFTNLTQSPITLLVVISATPPIIPSKDQHLVFEMRLPDSEPIWQEHEFELGEEAYDMDALTFNFVVTDVEGNVVIIPGETLPIYSTPWKHYRDMVNLPTMIVTIISFLAGLSAALIRKFWGV